MKTLRIAIAMAGSIVLALAPSAGLAQPPVITSFQSNGQLTWTNVTATNGFAVQWAPAVTGPWSSSWDALASLITSGSQTTVPVPAFYRVAQGFSLASMRGTWIYTDAVNSPTNGGFYFTAEEDGILSESAIFIPRGPAGLFTVDVGGRVTNTFLFTGGGGITLPGTFVSPNIIKMDPVISPNGVLSRVDDASRCAGNWTGTLFQTNGPGTPTNYPVSFSADPRGLVTNFTGFTGLGIGRIFALTNGAAVGFFTPGNYNDNGVYDQFRISGTLTGNSLMGSYKTDSGSGAQAVLGTASLTRQ
jgi:hypothetical protein